MKPEIDIFQIYKDQIKALLLMAIALLFMVLALIVGCIRYEMEIDDYRDKIAELERTTVGMVYEEAETDILASSPTFDEPAVKETVYFTNYYADDGYGTGTVTGSGLGVDDFDINDKGWYTYEGKVVIAAATNEGLRSNWGSLAKYNEAEPGITYYNYYDELDIHIDGVTYPAIVLDTCGASMNIDYLNKHDNGINRLDIFISGKEHRFGKVEGYALDKIEDVNAEVM